MPFVVVVVLSVSCTLCAERVPLCRGASEAVPAAGSGAGAGWAPARAPLLLPPVLPPAIYGLRGICGDLWGSGGGTPQINIDAGGNGREGADGRSG